MYLQLLLTMFIPGCTEYHLDEKAFSTGIEVIYVHKKNALYS